MNFQNDEYIKRINERTVENNNDIISKNSNTDIKLSSKNKNIEEKDKDSLNNKYNLNKNNLFKKTIKIIFNIIRFLFTILMAFCKNIIYKGYVKLKHYLNHRYGQANSRRIIIFLIIFGFVIIYSLILYICQSYKMKNLENPIKLIENNSSSIFESKNETNNNINQANFSSNNRKLN